MKNLILALSLIALTFSCHTATTAATPPELKAVPQSQSVALEVVMEKIATGDPAWVTATGDIKRDAILPILAADKAAWDKFDTFYNK